MRLECLRLHGKQAQNNIIIPKSLPVTAAVVLVRVIFLRAVCNQMIRWLQLKVKLKIAIGIQIRMYQVHTINSTHVYVYDTRTYICGIFACVICISCLRLGAECSISTLQIGLTDPNTALHTAGASVVACALERSLSHLITQPVRPLRVSPPFCLGWSHTSCRVLLVKLQH